MQHSQVDDSSDSDGSIEEGRMERRYTKGQSASAQQSFTSLQHKDNLPMDEAYEALYQKFGSDVVSSRTFKRWWDKLSRGEDFASTGRPSHATPTIIEQMETDVPSSSQKVYDMKPVLDTLKNLSSDDEYCVDDYTDCCAIFGDRDRDHDLALGIDVEGERRQRERDAKGRFVTTKDSCVFCDLPIYPFMGYGVLSCGHTFHWEATYAKWLEGGSHRICPKRDCTRMKIAKQCAGCQEAMGVGNFETMCYCQSEIGQSDLHADCLENGLANNKGLCLRCSKPHPGFCSMCQKLFYLPSDGKVLRKIYRKCCHSYVHQSCWDLEPETKCPYGCDPYQGIVSLPAISFCGVSKPSQMPEVVKARGIIGGRGLGCKKPEIYGKYKQCVLCDKSGYPVFFLSFLQCGHAVHLGKEFLDWITTNPEGPTDMYGYNDEAPCPKCGTVPFNDCVKCGERVLNGMVQLQHQCTHKLCPECYKEKFIETGGKCILKKEPCKAFHSFCALCCEFIAILPDGQPNVYDRLAGVKERNQICRNCRSTVHWDHYTDWVTRFYTASCPVCRQALGKDAYLRTLPVIKYPISKLQYVTTQKSITYYGKQYPLFKTDRFLKGKALYRFQQGFCLFCDKSIGFKMQAAVLRCCNAFFHVPHLENWIKRVGAICPNCANNFGTLGDNSLLYINQPATVIPDYHIDSRMQLAGVKQCCKNLVTRLHLEKQGAFCADCDFCLDNLTLETTHYLGWPERHCETSCKWSDHLCVFCNCKISLGAQPVFLDCGHLLHYTCFISWALTEDPARINTKQDTYIDENLHDNSENMLSTPNIFTCPCGYHQEIRRVADYYHKKHFNTPEKNLENWQIIHDILQHRQTNNLIPFIGTKNADPVQEERWVCRLCGGDFLNYAQDGVEVCYVYAHKHGHQKVHNRCFRNWFEITNCSGCQIIAGSQPSCAHCKGGIQIEERYRGCRLHTTHGACYDAWLGSLKCRMCTQHKDSLDS